MLVKILHQEILCLELLANADPYKYKYSGYAVGFDPRKGSSLSNGSGFGKISIIFTADTSLYVHLDIMKKDTLILGNGSAQGLDDTTLFAEKEQRKTFY